MCKQWSPRFLNISSHAIDVTKNVNLADDPSHKATAASMHQQLLAFFRQSQRVQKATPQPPATATEPDTSDPFDN